MGAWASDGGRPDLALLVRRCKRRVGLRSDGDRRLTGSMDPEGNFSTFAYDVGVFALGALATTAPISFEGERVLIRNDDVTDAIRTPASG